ncbi:hypothetical protein EJ08DRAFT_680694 [Tothia fuscella]|uniref:Uncharacterized protein n=1 Tax=Tothia fuscella TaxID=1048955 RepID=A0A9P4NNE8_9PEZI|nr:hypothetical protein EJ08DRAFT_680694 [Tothia fuscella]
MSPCSKLDCITVVHTSIHIFSVSACKLRDRSKRSRPPTSATFSQDRIMGGRTYNIQTFFNDGNGRRFTGSYRPSISRAMKLPCALITGHLGRFDRRFFV